MLRKSTFILILGFICFSLLLLTRSTSQAAENDTTALDSLSTDELIMIVGELETLKVYTLTRVSIGDPSIADIVEANETEVLLVAKKEGETPVFLWDDNGKRIVLIKIFASDLQRQKIRVMDLLKKADIYEASIDVDEAHGRLVVTGDIPEHKKEQFNLIIDPISEQVINITQEEKIKDLIQIDMQISEINSSAIRNLGVEWSTSGSALAFNYQEDFVAGEFGGKPADWFKIGDFERTNSLNFLVNAIIEEGKGEVLSKPKLVVVSGEQASFLVGGQVPVRTTVATDQNFQENVTFKDFGVGMTITPTIVKEKVEIKLNIEISDVDSSLSVDDNVGFSTNSASTTLYLDDEQTVVMAGLIKKNRGETINRVPFISKVPIVGAFFRNRNQNPISDKEIIVSLTPTILQKNRNRSIRKLEDSMNKPPEVVENKAGMNKRKIHAAHIVDEQETVPQEMKDYVRELQKQIAQNVVYPKEAEQYGWEGTVSLGLLILRDGTLAYALVKESSGHEIFDEYALNTAKNIAPYGSFPSGTKLQELKISVPIIYSLKR